MPNVVKGSKQEKMIIVPFRPWNLFFMRTALVLGMSLCAFGGFMFGYYDSGQNQQNYLTDQQQLSADISLLRVENEELRKQIAILDRTSVMDRHAQDEVANTIRSQREKIIQLEQDIVFYRQVVSPDSDEKGMVIGQMDINATAVPRRFRYRAVMRQYGVEDSTLVGYVNINIIGYRDGERQVIPLRDLTDDENQLDIKLGYRYFQNIEGELVIPEGFVPDQIHVAAVSTSPIEKRLNENFSWVVTGK